MSLVKGRQAAIQIVMFTVKLCSQAVCLTWSAANTKQDLCWSELMTTSGTWHEWINCRWGVSLNPYPCYLLTIFFFFCKCHLQHLEWPWISTLPSVLISSSSDPSGTARFSLSMKRTELGVSLSQFSKHVLFIFFSVPFPLVCMIVYIHTFLWHVHLANFL